MGQNKLNSKITLLAAWLLITNVALGFCIYKMCVGHIASDEITAKRINIIGEDNLPRIVLSNELRQHSGRIEGKDFPKRERPAGVIFFNNEGNESGGIISAVYDKNGKINSGMSFTMDRYNNDQVIQILNNEMYQDGVEKIQRGFLVSEFPTGAKFYNLHNEYEKIKKIEDPKKQRERTLDLLRREGAKKRIYLGKSFNEESGLTLYDKEGTPVLKILVDKNGQPQIQYSKGDGQMVDLINTGK